MNKVKTILYNKSRYLKININNFTQISLSVNTPTSAAHFAAG